MGEKEDMCYQDLVLGRGMWDSFSDKCCLFFSQEKCRCIRVKCDWVVVSFINFLAEKPVGRKLLEHPILLFFWKMNFIISFQYVHFV